MGKNNQPKSPEAIARADKRDIKKLKTHLTDCMGIITYACKSAGISRNKFYDIRNRNPDFKKWCENLIEKQIDHVEYALFKKIREGDTRAITFFLRTKGRSRGYSEKLELGGKIQQEVVFQISGIENTYPDVIDVQSQNAEEEEN